MGCLPVRAKARGLSYVQVDKHGVIFYTTYINLDRAHHEIFRDKVDKGGIKRHILLDQYKGVWFLSQTYD